MTKRTTLLGTLAATAALSLSACGVGGNSTDVADVEAGSIDASALEGQTVAVGSKEFDEQLVLGQIALLALKAAGAEVEDRTDITGSTATRNALLGGDFDVYWDYTGTGWINYLGNDEPIADSQEQYEAVAEQDLAENDVVWGTPAPMNNTYAFATNSEFAQQTGVQNYSDMGELSESDKGQVTLCVESEFQGRPDGLPGFLDTYEIDIPGNQVESYGIGVIYDQVANGNNCNFGEVFTTDGRIAALDLTVLEDDQNFFPIYNVAPIVMQETNQQTPGILEVLNPISEVITTEKMTAMNERISVSGDDPAVIAEDFLREEGFIS
ncbi:glycine betaine ABC transporter substrate-binding protein [Nocardioidaceae bacterium]|nr:glycine betaine ABC transporter substrate-binding protein [Nocardioidaceae bacterium]